jgi:mRNA interferase RelE/StbE
VCDVTYEIEILPAALREIDAIPGQARQRIIQRIDALAAQPRPSGVVAMTGSGGALRIRVGDYRVVYRVDDQAKKVTVERVGHRRDVYR